MTTTRRRRGSVPLPEPWMGSFVRRLASKWHVSTLAASLTVEYSPLLRRSLGRASVAHSRVRLNFVLRDAPREIVREVLAHELAHLVVSRRARTGSRPHGARWAALMEAAGFPPRRRIPYQQTATPALDQRSRYVHSCPVCHATRYARRPVARWRCTACVENGLDGRLVIEEVASR